MFDRLIIRKITSKDDITQFKVARHRIESSIKEGLAFGAFKKDKCISYIAPIDATHSYENKQVQEFCATKSTEFEEIRLHFEWAKHIYCIPSFGGAHVTKLLNEFYNELTEAVICYTPYFNLHNAFKAAGFSSMSLIHNNKEILIR